ncbi:type VI secretion system accessory protein TagJ [Burkholderia sp. Bp8998]|uniref:type VI secretion system accessory protein TagJ n=1 Tax=Burkholderia sp. Bp8998 TaxID=2184557 RepID=UPI000F59FE1E|nr:type VI secretion system accessory protein TagJ [Burkholderia sp. Bp8998]RQS18319.1 ImpE/SciE family protein [Burkholderia sp. Bp8998]
MNMSLGAGEPAGRGLDDVSIAIRIERIESCIRAQPAVAAHRWALFQWLCVTGDWARAVIQLQTWAKLEPQQTQAAQVYRDLVRAERWRQKVVAGFERPGFVLEPAPWVMELAFALRLAGNGQREHADEAREKALDAAPLTAAHTPRGVASWIADSDSRFGPVCEVMTAGHYRWVPFADLAAWRVSPPADLIDLVWAPCVLTLTDGSAVRGFMPARYPDSEAATDALRLGRETAWHESGRTTVIAVGQKTWTTDRGDFGLFELAHAQFGSRVAAGTTTGEPVDD